MSLFQLYETERKPFKVGTKWICVDHILLGFDANIQDEIVQIIDFNMNMINGLPIQSVRIEILTSRYDKGGKYRYRLDTFKQCYKPYTARRL